MLSDAMRASSVERLKGLLKDRYGMGLKVNFLVDASKKSLWTQDHQLSNGDLEVPIIARGRHMATVVIPSAGRLPPTEHDSIADMVRLVLEPTLYVWFLEQEQENLSNQRISTTLPNVSSIMPVDDFVADHMSLATGLLLLEGTQNQIIKIASQIHEVAERWAYLRYNDIRPQIKTADDLRSMGAMTILLEDILSLTTPEQSMLVDFSQHSNTDSEPLLLVGSLEKVDFLVKIGRLGSDVGKVLLQNRIEIDRLPQDPQKLKEVLTLILDREATVI